MTQIKTASLLTKFQKIDIVKNENLPNAIHGKHGIMENSGFSSAKKFKEIVVSGIAESRSQTSQIIRTPEISEEKEDKSKLDLFFDVHKKTQDSGLFVKLIQEIDPEFVKHGGGSLYDYAKLAQLNGQRVTTITIHESRMLQLLYAGEENLAEKGIARGQFVEEEFDFLLEQAKKVGEELGVKIEFVLELENFGKGKMGNDLRKKRQEFRDKFQYKVLSTHFIRKNPEFSQASNAEKSKENHEKFSDNHQFIDGSLEQFEDVLSGHATTKRIIKSGNINQIAKIVKTYVQDILDQIEEEGKKGMVLGHCDLIKLNLHKILAGKNKKFADEIISEVFVQEEIQNIYGKLFDAVNEKEMFVEVNLAGAAKGVGFYGKDLLEKMNEKNVKVVVGSDSHNVYDEKGAEEIWKGEGKYKGESVREALISVGITNVYEIALNPKSEEPRT